ncbi:hypothetical protein BGZ52_007811, partial [Haplosporangium bisporale]
MSGLDQHPLADSGEGYDMIDPPSDRKKGKRLSLDGYINHEPPYGSSLPPARSISYTDMRQQMRYSILHQGSQPKFEFLYKTDSEDGEFGSSPDFKASPELPSSISGWKTNE